MQRWSLGLAALLVVGPALAGVQCGAPPPDTFVIAGQSNATGFSSLPRGATSSYAHRLHSLSYREYLVWGGIWKLANDPLHDPFRHTASAWPWMAEWWHENRGRPLEFVAAAEPATCLVAGAAEWEASVGSLYQRMLAWVANADVGERLDAVLWYQGECDAAYGVAPEVYQAALEDLADAVVLDLGVPLVVAPVSLGLAVDGTPSPVMQPIHDATLAAAAAHPDVWPGPSTDDLALEPDELHVHAVDELGVRWGEAVAAVLDSL